MQDPWGICSVKLGAGPMWACGLRCGEARSVAVTKRSTGQPWRDAVMDALPRVGHTCAAEAGEAPPVGVRGNAQQLGEGAPLLTLGWLCSVVDCRRARGSVSVGRHMPHVLRQRWVGGFAHRWSARVGRKAPTPARVAQTNRAPTRRSLPPFRRPAVETSGLYAGDRRCRDASWRVLMHCKGTRARRGHPLGQRALVRPDGKVREARAERFGAL